MFTIQQSGHAEIMCKPTQQVTHTYKLLKSKYIDILNKKEVKSEVDKIDRRRTLMCVEANKLSEYQLRCLIEGNKQTEELLKTIYK